MRRSQACFIEIWVPSIQRAVSEWGWLLGELGYVQHQDYSGGRSWRHGGTYLVFEESPALSSGHHDRRRPGLNHLAFHVDDRSQVDRLVAAAPDHGWSLLLADRHPFAGVADHYAGYLENSDGYEVELVASAR